MLRKVGYTMSPCVRLFVLAALVVSLTVLACKGSAPASQAVVAEPAAQPKPPSTEKTARDYYNELDKAHGLEGFSNEYVCFRDDPNDEQFLTFSKTQNIAKLYPWENFPAKDRAAAKAAFEKPGLLMLGYKKGIQNGDPVVFDKDGIAGNSWVMLTKIKGMRIHFTINWQTLRYRWSVEEQRSGAWAVVENADTFGQCEDRTTKP
jgi:hypothetical protein